MKNKKKEGELVVSPNAGLPSAGSYRRIAGRYKDKFR
jgi:hypothetical protein